MFDDNSRVLRSAFVLLIPLAASACNGDGDDGGLAEGGVGAGGEAVELDALAEVAARTTCARVFDCCSAEEVAEHFNEPGFFSFSTVDECVAFYQGVTEALALPALRTSIERGYADYDPQAAGACLDDIAAASCDALNLVGGGGGGGNCLDAITPRQDNGDPCVADSDCIDGFCDSAGGEQGTCLPLPQSTEVCTFTCAEPLRCGLDSDQEYRCLPRLEGGQPCARDEDCESQLCDGDAGAQTCRDERVCQGS